MIEENGTYDQYDADDRKSFADYFPFCCSWKNIMKDQLSHAFQHWKVLLFGQFLSFCLATNGATTSELFLRCGLNAPTAQYSIMYLLLSFHLLPIFFKGGINWKNVIGLNKMSENNDQTKYDEWNLETSIPSDDENSFDGNGKDDESRNNQINENIEKSSLCNVEIKGPIWLYFIMAIMDVEANFFTILAFRYTTLTSITLLDSLAIPGAMIASKVLLRCNYRPIHLLGASICFVGTVLNVFSDYEDNKQADMDGDDVIYVHDIRGDLLAALGGILYGVNDAIAELLVKKYDRQEYIGFTGFFGFFFSLIQAFIIEKQDIIHFFDGSATCQQSTIFTLMVLFLLSNYLSFTGISKFLKISEAALLNLSLLTGDIYAVIFSIFGEHIIPSSLFFVAMIMIISGVLLYETAPTPTVEEFKNKTVPSREDADFSSLDENFVTMDLEMTSNNEKKHSKMIV